MARARGAAAVALCLFILAEASTELRGAGGFEGLAKLRPEEVGHLLSEVERQWEAEALTVLQGRADAENVLQEMKNSCIKVSQAIVSGSEGTKDKVVEYLTEVCGSDNNSGDRLMCQKYSAALEQHMSADSSSNREDLNIPVFCEAFYRGPVQEAAKLQVEALKAAASKKDAEDRKAAEERKVAEAKKKAEDEQAHEKAREEEQRREENEKKTADGFVSMAHQDVQRVRDIVAKAQQHFTQAVSDSDTISEHSAAAQLVVDRARQEMQMADEKEAEVAEAKAREAADKAREAAEKVAELRKRKAAVIAAAAQRKAVQEKTKPAKTEETKVEHEKVVDKKPEPAKVEEKSKVVVVEKKLEPATPKAALVVRRHPSPVKLSRKVPGKV